jgi:hypothetical protein
MSILHVFIYVCPAQEDFFAGVRRSLEKTDPQQHCITNLYLEDKEYDYITHVEFSIRKYARFLFYGSIFNRIEHNIVKILDAHTSQKTVVFYLADEGVWAEVIRDIMNRHINRRGAFLVNVQHGFMALIKPNFVWLRRILNSLARLFFGYPIYGFGFGGGSCDVHLAYGLKEVAFLQRSKIKLALSCPNLIKHDLQQQHQKTLSNHPVESDLILLALPACVPGGNITGSNMLCGLSEYLDTISPLVRWIRENTNYRILVRPHPGRRDQGTIDLIGQSALGPFVEIDLNKQLITVLSRSVIVMAAHSTVLLDSLYLGKVPLAIRSDCYDEALPFPHEVIDVRSPFADQLVHILSAKRRKHYSSRLNKPELDWKHEIEKFVTQCLDTN